MNELHELRSRLWDHPALSLDLETTSRDPSAAQLEIVAMAAGYGPSLYAVALPPTTEVLDFVVACLNDPRLRIIGHNLITYDLVVLHYRNILKFGTAKARLVDTLPLVWLLDENADHGLKYSSKHYLDHTMVEYEEAFLASPSYMRSKELELTKNRLNHEFEMTVKGLAKDRKTDKNRLMAELKTKFKGKKTLEDRIDKLALTGNISKYLDDAYGRRRTTNLKAKLDADCSAIDQQIEEALRQWNIDKYLYAADDARQTLRLYRTVRSRLKEAKLLTWADIEIKNRIVAAEMKMEGVPFLPSKVAELKAVVVPLINEFEWQMYDIAKTEFNPNSPQQVKRILYDVVGVPPIDGSYSTDEKSLSRMYHPIAQALLNYRTVSKLNSTYIVRMEQEIAKGLPTRLRAIFNTIGTVTGRWSSSKPNLQNIPSKAKPAEYDPRIQNLGPKIREAFSGLTEDLLMISADLSQIELRIIAHITQDARLLDIYNQMTEWHGLKFYTGDIHRNTSEALNISRKIAKNCNFGLCYGMGATKFARYAKLFIEGTKDYDFNKSRVFVDTFMSLYCGIQETLDRIDSMLNNTDPKLKRKSFGLITGRRRHFTDNDRPFPGMVLNTIVQGSAADLLKIIVWYIYSCVVKHPDFAGTIFSLQVHDEVGLFAPRAIAEKVAIMVKYIMERPWFKLDVPVLASVKVCDCWADKDNDDIPEIGVMPTEDTKIKPCVAMLTPEQEAWAATYLPNVVCYSAK